MPLSRVEHGRREQHLHPSSPLIIGFALHDDNDAAASSDGDGGGGGTARARRIDLLLCAVAAGLYVRARTNGTKGRKRKLDKKKKTFRRKLVRNIVCVCVCTPKKIYTVSRAKSH